MRFCSFMHHKGFFTFELVLKAGALLSQKDLEVVLNKSESSPPLMAKLPAS